jgi:hypothetical protein
VVLAVVGLARSTDPARWPVAALAAVVPLAYLPFWGPHAIGDMWDGVQHFGPFYYLPVLVPLVTFGSAAMVLVARHANAGSPRWLRPLAAVGVAAMLVLTTLALPDKVTANLAVKADFQALQQFIDQQQIGTGVLLLPARGNLGFVSSSPFLQNEVSLNQPVLYAETRGARDFELIDRYPDRPLYRLTQELPPGRTTGGQLSMDLLHVESGPSITIRLRVTNHTEHPVAIAYVHGVGEDRTRVLDQNSGKGQSYDIVWTLAAPGAGPTSPDVIRLPAGLESGMLAVGLKVDEPGGAAGSIGSRWEQRIPYRVVAGGSGLELLRPGQGWSIEDTDSAIWQPNATAAR